MNLKHRLNHKTTATVRIINDTQAIFSDECTDNHSTCLSIIEANDKAELWNKIINLAKTQASLTRFHPKINVISPDGKLYINTLEALESSKPSEYQP